MGADPDTYALIRDTTVDKLIGTNWLDVQLWSEWTGAKDIKNKTAFLDLIASRNKIEVGANPIWFLAGYIQVSLRRVSKKKEPFVMKAWNKHHLRDKFLTSCVCFVKDMYHIFFMESVPTVIRTTWSIQVTARKARIDELRRMIDDDIQPPEQTGQSLTRATFRQATGPIG